MYIGSRHRKINRISPSNIFSKDCRGFQFFEAVRKSLGNSIPIIVEDLGEVTREVFQLRDHFQFYGIRILQMGFYTYPDNIYVPHNYIPTEQERIDDLQFEEHLAKYISWYLIQIILQSASNEAILLMQDLLYIDIRMNYPGKGYSSFELRSKFF